MTEDGAKTKWCPFQRTGFVDAGASCNRPDGNLNCIASACMAWREEFVGGGGIKHGYCGLAGKP